MFNFFKIFNFISVYFWFLFCLLYDFFNLGFSLLDLNRSKINNKNIIIYNNFNKFLLKKFFFDNFIKKNFFLIDSFSLFFYSLRYNLKNYDIINYRSFFRNISTNKGFYINFSNLNYNNFIKFYFNFFFSIIKYLWFFLKYWVLPIFIVFLIIYFTISTRLLPFNKLIFSWISIIMFVYWIISGFVFFIKKYQFGKYTSVVQRFWRRTYILFWLLETATFSVFLFVTINSSQESFYMFDQISIFKTHLYSWKLFFLKIFPLVILIVISYTFIISLKWNIFSKHSVWLFFITLFLTFIVWLEFYQFFHVLNFYGNLNWVYDLDDHSWSLEQEPRKTRIVNHYVMLLFILKFWHIIFIYGFWIFFVLRSLEINRIRYPLLSANFQNFIILYVFAWIFMYPWFKFFFRKFLDSPYFWFYISNRKLFFRVFFNDFKLLYYGLLNYFYYLKNNFLFFFKYDSFFYWKLTDYTNFESYRKNYIKNQIFKNI